MINLCLDYWQRVRGDLQWLFILLSPGPQAEKSIFHKIARTITHSLNLDIEEITVFIFICSRL
jgi:hypothetical protein